MDIVVIADERNGSDLAPQVQNLVHDLIRKLQYVSSASCPSSGHSISVCLELIHLCKLSDWVLHE